MSAEERLAELGLELEVVPGPTASYVTYVRTGSIAYTSGHGPLTNSGDYMVGKVGVDLDIDAGREAARLTGIGLLATLRHNLGSLDRVRRLVKVFGMVNCPSDFTEHAAVINGCSDLLVDVFGDAGRHARSAIGVGSLPMNIPVVIDAVVEVD